LFPVAEEAILKVPAFIGLTGFGMMDEIEVLTRSVMLRLDEDGGRSPEGDMERLEAVLD